jgi:hypothetical protein
MRAFSVLTAVAALAIAACKGTEPFVPQATTVLLSSTSLSFSSIGATHLLAATVLDQHGDTIPAEAIAWSSGNTAVATVNPSPPRSAVVAAAGNGSTQIVATAGTTVRAQATVTVSQVAVQLVKVSGDAQTDTVGQQLPSVLVIQTSDANGNPVPNVAVSFEVTQGGGGVSAPSGTTGSNGRFQVSWTLGTTAGAQVVRVAAGSVPPVTFDATAVDGPSPSMVESAGNHQTGLSGFPLNVSPAVLVRDAANNPLQNVRVDFGPSGGGTVTGSSAMTDVNGIATVGSWTVQLGTNTLTATAAGAGVVGSPVTFTATGAPQEYSIALRYLTNATTAQRQAFDSAGAKWQRLIYGDLPGIDFGMQPLDAGRCGSNSPTFRDDVDDVLIFVTLDSIDGPGKILGQAGPCVVRSFGRLPILGLMQFDTADVARLLSDGQLDEVVLHEMGHVLGYGTIWGPQPDLGLLVDGGGPDPHYVGAQATAAFDRHGGQNYSAGAKVPVENTGSPGTRDAHWREAVFRTELMTGFLNGGVANPLSAISTASMEDLQYVVNYAGSDPYTVTNPLALRALEPGPTIELKDDILRLPILEVDARGRVVRVIQPRD